MSCGLPLVCLLLLLSGCERPTLGLSKQGADPVLLGTAPAPKAPTDQAPPGIPQIGQPAALPVSPVPQVTPPAGSPFSFAQLAQQCDSAVVFVRTVTSRRRGFYRELQGGSGSGFIFDPTGKILTNYHVVQGAHAIEVELSDQRTLRAKVVGADPHTDVAVLSVEAGKLPALPLGDSAALAVGDWVLAIGNPFGLSHTVSAGIISAKGRTSQDVQLGNPGAYYSFLQTDASINPGNSGGPLIDLSGRVVGMNTAINPEANSIGFAIPVNMLRELLPRLLADGVVQRAAIGVQVDSVHRQVQEQLGLPDRRGAVVLGVQPGGPAMRAGFQPGDVIIEFGGKAIGSPEDLRWRSSLSTVGVAVPVIIRRDGKEETINVVPAPMSLP